MRARRKPYIGYEAQYYRLNKFLCWHSRRYIELLKSNNGVVMYCGKCGRKIVGIHDFNFERAHP